MIQACLNVNYTGGDETVGYTRFFCALIVFSYKLFNFFDNPRILLNKKEKKFLLGFFILVM